MRSGLAEKLRSRGHVAGSWGLCREDRTAAKAWPTDENISYFTKLPLRGMYLPLSSRGSIVIFLHRRDFIYIALGLDGNSSIRIAS
jgi:hypothetical protein